MPIRHGCTVIPEHVARKTIKEIRGNRHLVYLRNTGYNCFLSSVAWFFIKDEAANPLDASTHDYMTFFSKLNLDGIEFGSPLTIEQMKLFVKKNKEKLDCRVNILAAEKNDVYAYEIGIGNKDGKCIIV